MDYEYAPGVYSGMAYHMSHLDEALAEVERLRVEVERLQAELDNRIRYIIAANKRAELAEATLSELKIQVQWLDA